MRTYAPLASMCRRWLSSSTMALRELRKALVKRPAQPRLSPFEPLPDTRQRWPVGGAAASPNAGDARRQDPSFDVWRVRRAADTVRPALALVRGRFVCTPRL